MLMTLLSKPLTMRKISTFDHRLVNNHIGVDHAIFSIPKHYTILDALSYIFNDDAIAISNVLQDYVDIEPRSRELIKGIEGGVKDKVICLTCIKNSVQHMLGNN